MRGSVQCTRTQFPLCISYAVTVHKSQGMTLDKVVVDISDRQYTSSLAYVAVSRVKTLHGLMFDKPFTLDDMTCVASRYVSDRETDKVLREAQEVPCGLLDDEDDLFDEELLDEDFLSPRLRRVRLSPPDL